ncbi:hypothetical protein P152DRAFT_184082 [Eremomyces bilateralis CBS 781.70]|uniref:Uncharacterized protein n=1 Tax=Eremomyces bilateralis CBS 781.70 TaxID=1392243 RepID=A0A6G1GBC7_9PEZI|nr:uncharacterized protein P152DRAFT_184082 [Eremomyces bilateralis CBS 781.70]KAF1815398.1 hypothetical protein P152DRAFT_184082 [Eremomyces bilateralis CBS 781.70]
MASIPLICSICPKRPRFSDVSHLLTHIASKGHLSHHYKVKVRASTEEDSRRLLEAYDHWYEKWRVQDLMSERMSLKDKRRARAARNQTPLSRSQSVARRSQASRDTPTSQANSVDPRLGDEQLKVESPAPHPYYLHYPTNGIPMHNGPQSLAPYTGQPQQMSALPIRRRTDNNDDADSDLSYVPRSRESMIHVGTTTERDGFEVSEATRLKGVYWPGMDLFDSATPEMKRKRNQKKDTSVIKQLEANSLEVEANELVFTPEGTLKKTRNISGDPSDDSDDEWGSDGSASPEPTHKAPTSRQPLAALPFGVGRQNDARNDVFTDTPAAHSTFTDDRAEWDLAYGANRKRKRGFEIFHDRDMSFGNPAGMNVLNSDFHATQAEESVPNGTVSAVHRPGQKSTTQNNYFFENFHDDLPSVNQENRPRHTESRSINGMQQLQDAGTPNYKFAVQDLAKLGARNGNAHGNTNGHGFVQARQDVMYQFVPSNNDFQPFEPFGHQNWLNQNTYYNSTQTFDGDFDDARTISAPPSEHKADD